MQLGDSFDDDGWAVTRVIPSLADVALRAVNGLAAGLLVTRGDMIDYANPRAAALLGRVELEGESLRALGLPACDGACDEDPIRFEHEVVSADGESRRLGFTVSRFPSGTDLGGRMFLFQDISQFDGVRRERDRLLQLAAIHAVLPSILHELRNPITAITTTVEVMLEDAPVAMQGDLHAILCELRQISLTLQGVGAVGRELRCDRDSVVDLPIEDTVRVLEGKARARGVVLDVAVDTMPLLRLDPAVLRAMVANLVVNAVAACSTGDRVSIRAGFADDTFSLVVQDTGRGMTPEVLARATELFFTTKALGSGIGLSLCSRAVEQAGGELEIASEPGHGTCVAITIPLGECG
jgi:signal transduction histidine kinase